MLPLGFFGKLLSAATKCGVRLLVHLEIVTHIGADGFCTLEVIVVVAMQNADSVGQTAGMSQFSIHPLAETAKIGGDTGNFEGDAF